MLRPVSCDSRRFLAFEELEQLPFLFHLFTVKQSGPVLSLRSRKLQDQTLLSCLGRTEPRVLLTQRHGSAVIWVGKEDGNATLEGDGLLTSVPGLLLIVQTADCLSVLLVDARRRIVGNLHAGWRGTLANITGAAIQQMLGRGSNIADLTVAFGPAIGSCCYQVGPEVVAAFKEKFADSDTFFVSQVGRERRFLDLRKANYDQAIQLGLKPHQIVWNSYCTQCDSEMFFSYRREGAHTGRMYTVIGMR